MKISLMGVIALITPINNIQNLYASEQKEHSDQSDNILLLIPAFAVPMYSKNRPKGNITITVSLQIPDEEKRAQAQKYMPRLSSAYVMEANRLSHGYFDVNRPVNVGMLGDNLQLVTNRVLGHKLAKLFISNAIVNK